MLAQEKPGKIIPKKNEESEGDEKNAGLP